MLKTQNSSTLYLKIISWSSISEEMLIWCFFCNYNVTELSKRFSENASLVVVLQDGFWCCKTLYYSPQTTQKFMSVIRLNCLPVIKWFLSRRYTYIYFVERNISYLFQEFIFRDHLRYLNYIFSQVPWVLIIKKGTKPKFWETECGSIWLDLILLLCILLFDRNTWKHTTEEIICIKLLEAIIVYKRVLVTWDLRIACRKRDSLWRSG